MKTVLKINKEMNKHVTEIRNANTMPQINISALNMNVFYTASVHVCGLNVLFPIHAHTNEI